MKYRVSYPVVCYVHIEVEAESKEDAIDLAYDDFGVTAFCGNGGTDKLIGVCGENVTIEAGEEVAEGKFILSVEAEEIQ